jgi:hypothetical protein
MTRQEIIRKAGSGAVAGLAGTLLIQGLQSAGQKVVPKAMPPLREHPGEFVVQRVEEFLPDEAMARIPEKTEKTAAQLLGIGYGLTFAALYGLAVPRPRSIRWEGTALGLLTWAAGYLGWLPALGLMPRVTRQRPLQVAGGILPHIAYGIATVWTLRQLRRGSR